MDKSEIKKRIDDEIAKTKALIAEYKTLTKPVAPDEAIGRVSRMDAINNKSVTEAALRQSEQKLRSLEHARGKLDSPKFGVCLRCENPIPLGRILLRPESPYCVNCAQ